MKSKSKSIKIILSIVLVVAILASSVIGTSFLLRQPKSSVIDKTIQEQTQNSTDGTGDGKKEPQATISQNVVMIEGEAAAKVNNSISNITNTSAGTYVTLAEGTAIDDLGVGDIFFLDGSESTPIGEPYFGKIVSTKTTDGTTKLLLETPMIDEVFDTLCFQTDDLFKDGAQAEVKAIDGAVVTVGDNTVNVDNQGSSSVSMLANTSEKNVETEKLASDTIPINLDDALKIKLPEIDLLKAFKLIKGEKDDPKDYDQGSPSTKVFVTAKSYAYHRENCFHLKSSKTVSEITLSSAIDNDKRPCKSCKPEVLDNVSLESSVTATGSVGIENLKCEIYYDWDILNGNGMNDFWIDITGNLIGEVSVNATGEFKFGGNDTEWSTDLGVGEIKLQGLKDKLFPIAFISVTQGFTLSVPAGSSSVVHNYVNAMPISLLIMVYIDIQGNIKASLTADFKYTKDFEVNFRPIENGKINPEPDIKTDEPVITWSLEAGVEGDIDAHLGLSGLLYVFNLNVADIALIKVGNEIEGKIGIAIDQDTIKESKPWFEASYYSRMYLKLIDVKLYLKCKVDVFDGLLSGDANIDWDWTLMNLTLATWGEKLPTRYSPGIMSSTNITAQDADANYYKDENGYLTKEKDGIKSIIYRDKFFTICAIDESYIYVLKTNEDDDKHDIYRIEKTSGTSKEIANDITRVLYYDEEFIYYIDGFDDTIIYKLQRSDLSATPFADFEHKVEYMQKNELGLYVVTSDNGILSWLLGTTNYYYVLDNSGNIIREYGKNPAVPELSLTKHGNFYSAFKVTSGGIMWTYGTDMYWLSGDKSNHVIVECLSGTGWKRYKDIGIFTVEYNDSDEEDADRYMMVLYRAEDGVKVNVTPIKHNRAFFSLVQSPTGDWYFFDQSDDELILYTMNEDFSNKQVVKSFDLDELDFNFENCSAEIIGNRLFFYTIEDDKTCDIVKRYDLF